jgi:hypothetical protein
MRADRRRKKKLIVAFHFQFSNQAAWKCDTCRSQGLEKKRRCGWLDEGQRGPERLVWARRQLRLTECPKSLITPQSEEWLERYQVGRVFGFGSMNELPARVVDAFCVLEKELAAERNHDEE